MNPFFEVSVLFGIATILALVVKRLRLPLIVAYVVAGVLAGPLVLHVIQPEGHLHLFSQLGIAALLFVIGLTLSPHVLKEIGSTALVTGLGQCVLTAIPAYVLARVVGFGPVESGYVALGLTLSSTIVVSKVLSDKKELGTLHGKISIGFLLIQDILAAFALLAVASLGRGGGTQELVLAFGKTFLLFILMYLVGAKILPRLTTWFAESQDVLFLFSLGWGIGVAGLFQGAGLSLELGALVAGITLASSPYHHEMSSRMRIVRDFFLVVFFALLGSHLAHPLDGLAWLQVAIFSTFVLLVKPILVMLIMGLLGFHRKTSFLAGVAIAQISEFSFILLTLGLGFAHISERLLPIITVTGIVTMSLSALFLSNGEKVYRIFERFLGYWPWAEKHLHVDGEDRLQPRIVLIGCHRLGAEVLETIQRWKQPYVVLDFDPIVVRALQGRGIPCLYGDGSDHAVLEDVGLPEADLVIVTIPDPAVHRAVLACIRRRPVPAVVFLTASTSEQAVRLYEEGATYVINLHDVGGNFASLILDRCRDSHVRFQLERKKHVLHLKKRLKKGLLPSADLHHRWMNLH